MFTIESPSAFNPCPPCKLSAEEKSHGSSVSRWVKEKSRGRLTNTSNVTLISICSVNCWATLYLSNSRNKKIVHMVYGRSETGVSLWTGRATSPCLTQGSCPRE